MKTVIVVLLLGLVLFLFLLGGDFSDPGAHFPVPEYSWSEIDAIHRKGARLDEERRAQERFSEGLRRTRAAVLDGTVSLSEAADQLVKSASQNSPGFLEGAGRCFPGLPHREQVIRILLTHFARDEEAGLLTPRQRERRARLCQEQERVNDPASPR